MAAGQEPANKFEPSQDQREAVWAMAAIGGVTQEEMALAVVNPATKRPIGVETLRSHFPDEIATARATFKREIAVGLVADMRAGKANTTRIFLSKVICGLRETTRAELTGADGGPIDVKNLSDEQLASLASRLSGAAGG